jgi:ankyrin repeat protein
MPSRCLAMLAVLVQGLACSAALGQTPPSAAELAGDGGLHAAAAKGDVQALLDAGANPDLPDRQGQSPLALACSRALTPMIALLEAAGGR